jgi:O-antigen/teichoic acid export membrane protein
VGNLKFILLSSPVLTLARYLGSAAGFLSQLLLARLLPPDGLGTFFTVTSLASVLGLIAAQGYPSLFQRFFTRYRQKNSPHLFSALLTQAENQAVKALMSIAIIGAVVLAVLGFKPEMLFTVPAIGLCTIASTMFAIYPALASVERRFAIALLPETLFRPVVFMAALAIFIISTTKLTVGLTLVVYAVLSLMLACAQFFAVRYRFASEKPIVNGKLSRKWRSEAWPLLLTSLFTLMFADLVILATSLFLKPEQLGPFGIALKIAMLVGFALQIGQQTSLPDISDALHKHDAGALKKALLCGCLFPTMATSVALLGFILVGNRFMEIIGRNYDVAAFALIVITGSQVLRAIAGPAPLMLTLVGSQLTNAFISIASCVTVLAANAVLVPKFGVTGAGIAVLFAVSVWVIGSALALWRLHGLRSDLFYALSGAKIDFIKV